MQRHLIALLFSLALLSPALAGADVLLPGEMAQTLPKGPQHAPTVFTPHTLNIDFGPWRPTPSKKVGPAAAGNDGDFWNTVAVAWSNNHIAYDLQSAQRQWSPVHIRMVNLGGGWGNSGKMGVRDPMLDGFNYPQNNQGGDAQVILYFVPPGVYDLYLYGHGTDPVYYGDYTLTVGGRDQGRLTTSDGLDAVNNINWVEGSQYVRFRGVTVSRGDIMEILIRPGGTVSDNGGRRTFRDAMICGLQLVPIDPEMLKDLPLKGI